LTSLLHALQGRLVYNPSENKPGNAPLKTPTIQVLGYTTILLAFGIQLCGEDLLGPLAHKEGVRFLIQTALGAPFFGEHDECIGERDIPLQ
jgi:hypothetical protein